MRKRTVSVFVAALLFALSFTGCGGGRVPFQNLGPVNGLDFSDELLLEVLEDYGYNMIVAHEIYSTNEDWANKSASCSLTATDRHKYMTEYIDVTIEFVYETDYGWKARECTVNSSREEWRLAGSYSQDSPKLHFSYFKFNEDKSKNRTPENLSVTACESDEVLSKEFSVGELYDLRTNTLEYVSLQCCLKKWDTGEYISKYSFPVRVNDYEGDFTSINKFIYAAPVYYQNGKSNYILFLGKDDLACSSFLDYTVDEYNNRLVLNIWKLSPSRR